jgi:uncharacterized protein YjbI with pentapeptide repeats
VSFKEALFQSRNAEESLLAALNGCSRLTKQVSVTDQSEPKTFGAWFRRVQAQSEGLAAQVLSFLEFRGAVLAVADFYGANLQGTDLKQIFAPNACFISANLDGANLEQAFL